jgi:type I restriction enzyme S subunit
MLDHWGEQTRRIEEITMVKLHLKRALMQQLLTGKRRFREFDRKAWSQRSFSSFLSESRITGSDGAAARKLTVRLYAKGVLAKRDSRPGSRSTQYYRRHAGQFIYSKLDFLNGAFGIIPDSLDGYESTLDLPAFDIDESVDSRWLLYFVSREGFYRSQFGLANGGRKARRVNPDDLLKVKIGIPEKPEQARIADALQTLDREIDLRRRQLTALKQQKKGVMQKLLTGEVRVRV